MEPIFFPIIYENHLDTHRHTFNPDQVANSQVGCRYGMKKVYGIIGGYRGCVLDDQWAAWRKSGFMSYGLGTEVNRVSLSCSPV